MVECKYCKGKMKKVKSKTFCFGIRVTYYCDRCHTTGDLFYKLLKSGKEKNTSRYEIKTMLDQIATKDLREFFTLVNSITNKHERFFPFMLDLPSPKTEEEKESERKWLEERRLIQKFKKKI